MTKITKFITICRTMRKNDYKFGEKNSIALKIKLKKLMSNINFLKVLDYD